MFGQVFQLPYKENSTPIWLVDAGYIGMEPTRMVRSFPAKEVRGNTPVSSNLTGSA